jgi:hypothetical protein
MDDQLFGDIEVDIKVPDHLNPTFAEMPTIYKNIEISRDDIGDHMKTYVEERNVMNQHKWSKLFPLTGLTPLCCLSSKTDVRARYNPGIRRRCWMHTLIYGGQPVISYIYG